MPEFSIHAFDSTLRRDCARLNNMETNSVIMMLRKGAGERGDNPQPHAFPLSSLLLSPSSPYSPPFPNLSASLSSPPFSQCPSTRYHFPGFLVPGLSTAKGYGLAFQAGAPNVSYFSMAILRLNEQGFVGKLTRKWWENTNNCPVEQTTSE